MQVCPDEAVDAYGRLPVSRPATPNSLHWVSRGGMTSVSHESANE